MNYTKPEITSLASASFVIQGSKGTQSLDSHNEPFETVSAYEADE
jgi:hypothetical protein